MIIRLLLFTLLLTKFSAPLVFADATQQLSPASLLTYLRDNIISSYPVAAAEQLPAERTYQSITQLIDDYRSVLTPHKQSVLLEVLTADGFKEDMDPEAYLPLLLQAKKQMRAQKAYWFYHFSLYKYLGNKQRYAQPEKDLERQLRYINHLIEHPELAQQLLIDNDTQAVGHIQPDISIDFLQRMYPKIHHTALHRLYVLKLSELARLLAPAITDYSFTALITELANPDASESLKARLNRVYQRRLQQNNVEDYEIVLYDWQRRNSVFLNLKLKAQYGESILASIRQTPLDQVYQSLSELPQSTSDSVIEWLLKTYRLDQTLIEHIDLIKIEINGEPV